MGNPFEQFPSAGRPTPPDEKTKEKLMKKNLATTGEALKEMAKEKKDIEPLSKEDASLLKLSQVFRPGSSEWSHALAKDWDKLPDKDKLSLLDWLNQQQKKVEGLAEKYDIDLAKE